MNQKVVHRLKTERKYFVEVWSGAKNFEVRFNDRRFARGDVVILDEIDELLVSAARRLSPVYSGRAIVATIAYVLFDFEGLAEGYVGFGLRDPTILVGASPAGYGQGDDVMPRPKLEPVTPRLKASD